MKISVGEATNIIKQEMKPIENIQKSNIKPFEVKKSDNTYVTISELVSVLTITVTNIVKTPKENLSFDNIAQYVGEVVHRLLSFETDTNLIKELMEQCSSIKI